MPIGIRRPTVNRDAKKVTRKKISKSMKGIGYETVKRIRIESSELLSNKELSMSTWFVGQYICRRFEFVTLPVAISEGRSTQFVEVHNDRTQIMVVYRAHTSAASRMPFRILRFLKKLLRRRATF